MRYNNKFIRVKVSKIKGQDNHLTKYGHNCNFGAIEPYGAVFSSSENWRCNDQSSGVQVQKKFILF